MKHGIYVTLFSDNTSDQHFAFLMFFSYTYYEGQRLQQIFCSYYRLLV